MKPFLNTKQLKGLISEVVEKNEIIFKIGQVIALSLARQNFLDNSEKILNLFLELKMAIAWPIFKILNSTFFKHPHF